MFPPASPDPSTANDPAYKSVLLKLQTIGYNYPSEKPTFSSRGKALLPMTKVLAQFSKSANPGQRRHAVRIDKRISLVIKLLYFIILLSI
jgi:hypothetical protein